MALNDDDSFMNVMRDYSIDPAFAHMHDAGEMPVYDHLSDSEPPVCFIGEAPGRTEQRKGMPFVGASGRVLDELLESIGLNRLDAYITNVVKYRPMADGKNREPSRQEVSESLPYLRRELRLVKPKVLCTLGNHALRAVVADAPRVSTAHGTRLTTRKGKPVLALYHPAVALYQPRAMSMLLNDFAVLGDWLKKDFE